MRRPKSRKHAKDTAPMGPSIADYYMAMLQGSAPPVRVPTYQDYLNWKATL